MRIISQTPPRKRPLCSIGPSPDNAGIELLIGELHLESGNRAAARIVMERLLDEGSASVAALLFAGQVEIHADRPGAAEGYCHSAYTRQPDNLKAITSIATQSLRRAMPLLSEILWTNSEQETQQNHVLTSDRNADL
ncbi:MAG: hypothetical protein HKM98_00265 [Gammaproteobacteria bacterium]|nr:hypothetical protein [Gammaproteobacteria bacterium]